MIETIEPEQPTEPPDIPAPLTPELREHDKWNHLQMGYDAENRPDVWIIINGRRLEEIEENELFHLLKMEGLWVQRRSGVTVGHDFEIHHLDDVEEEKNFPGLDQAIHMKPQPPVPPGEWPLSIDREINYEIIDTEDFMVVADWKNVQFAIADDRKVMIYFNEHNPRMLTLQFSDQDEARKFADELIERARLESI